jgi:hypothetical protein
MDATPKGSTELQLRAALYARLSETYDAAESVPTQLANAGRHAARRGSCHSAMSDALRRCAAE